MSQLISFIIPCYRSMQTIEKVTEEIKDTMAGLSQDEENTAHTEYAGDSDTAKNPYEIILVNDASPDDTFAVIQKICHESDNIIGINLSRNFGQHAALMAGLRQAAGDIVICLDDDGQTPAKEVGKLLNGIREGADVVYARYNHKQHSGMRRLGSRINDMMTRVMLGKPKKLYLSSYFAAKKFVVDEIKRYEGAYPYVVGLILRTTRNIVNVDIEHKERITGTSGYTLGKLMSLWFNGFTSFSIKPLRIAIVTGAVSAGVGFLYGLYTIIKKLFIYPDMVMGFSSLMSAVLFMGGMLMLMLGLVGEYIGRIYICINNSPQYVIREVINKKEREP